jgi:hypothetical protein
LLARGNIDAGGNQVADAAIIRKGLSMKSMVMRLSFFMRTTTS